MWMIYEERMTLSASAGNMYQMPLATRDWNAHERVLTTRNICAKLKAVTSSVIVLKFTHRLPGIWDLEAGL